MPSHAYNRTNYLIIQTNIVIKAYKQMCGQPKHPGLTWWKIDIMQP